MTTEKQTPEALAAECKRLADDYADDFAVQAMLKPASYQTADDDLSKSAAALHAAIDRLAALASAQAQQALTDLECPPDPEWVDRQMQGERAGVVPNGSGLVPKEWKLVPVEPTEEMFKAAAIGHVMTNREVWRAMVNAAPPVQQAEYETVPWPVVTRYSGGASPEGVAGRVWVRLNDDGPDIEYAPQPERAEVASKGWKLVPVDPTREMLDAYVAQDARFQSARTDWHAMLYAAPPAPAAEKPRPGFIPKDASIQVTHWPELPAERKPPTQAEIQAAYAEHEKKQPLVASLWSFEAGVAFAMKHLGIPPADAKEGE